MSKLYDVIIIGAGPAGLSAGLYAARAKMSALIIEKDRNGGQIVTTEEVANYPGGIKDETGPSLVARMVEQVEEFGAERVKATVLDVNLDGDTKIVTCEGVEYQAKAVIIATGASPRKLGCPGEVELTGKGVSYCATCDADFFTDFEVFAIGGGDTAVEEAMFLTKFARKVTLVHRRGELRAAKSIQEKAFKNDKIEFMWDSQVEEISGDGILETMIVKNKKTGELTTINADEEDGTFGLFGFIGYLPKTKIFEGQLDLEHGYVIGDDNCHTNIPGVFVAGDVRVKTFRQVITAAADGAISANEAGKYIESLED